MSDVSLVFFRAPFSTGQQQREARALEMTLFWNSKVVLVLSLVLVLWSKLKVAIAIKEPYCSFHRSGKM